MLQNQNQSVQRQFATAGFILRQNKNTDSKDLKNYQGQTEIIQKRATGDGQGNTGNSLAFLNDQEKTGWDQNFTVQRRQSRKSSINQIIKQKQNYNDIDYNKKNLKFQEIQENAFQDEITHYINQKQQDQNQPTGYKNVLFNNETCKKNRSFSMANQSQSNKITSQNISQQNWKQSYQNQQNIQANSQLNSKLPDIEIPASQQGVQQNNDNFDQTNYRTKRFNMTSQNQQEQWIDQVNKINNAPWKMQTPKTTFKGRNKLQSIEVDKYNIPNNRTIRNIRCQTTTSQFHHQKPTQTYQNSTFYNRGKLQELKFGNDFYRQFKDGKFDFDQDVYEKNSNYASDIHNNFFEDIRNGKENSINPFDIIMNQKFLSEEEKSMACKKIQNVNQINKFKQILENNQIQHNEIKRQIVNNKQQQFQKRYLQDQKDSRKLHLVEGKMVEQLDETIKNNFTFQVKKIQHYKKFLEQDDDENKRMLKQIKEEVKSKLISKQRENAKTDAMITLQNQTNAYLKGGKINNPELIRQMELTQKKLQDQLTYEEQERQEQLQKREEIKKINEKFNGQLQSQQIFKRSFTKNNQNQPNQEIINQLENQMQNNKNQYDIQIQDKGFISNPNNYYDIEDSKQEVESSVSQQSNFETSSMRNQNKQNHSLSQNNGNSINPSQIYYHGLPNMPEKSQNCKFQYEVSQMSNNQHLSRNNLNTNQSFSSFGEKNLIEVDDEKTDQARRAALYMKLIKGIYEQAENKTQVVKDKILVQKMREYWKVNNQGLNNSNKTNMGPEQVKAKFKKIRISLSDFFFTLNDKKVTPYEIIQNMGTNNQVFMSQPYERPGSFVFFKQLRKGSLDIILQKINSECRYYIFDKDHYLQTALHIALNRGYKQLSQYLINMGSDLSAKDLAGRTPLYYALKNGCFKLAQLMLFQKASPWAERGYSYENLVYGDKKMIDIIKRAKKIQLVLKFVKKNSERAKLWDQKKYELLEMDIEDINVSPRLVKLNMDNEFKIQGDFEKNIQNIKNVEPIKVQNDEEIQFENSEEDSDTEQYIKLKLNLKTEEDKIYKNVQYTQNSVA